MGYKWKPLVRAVALGPEPDDVVKDAAELWGCDEPEARRRLQAWHDEHRSEFWTNDLYQVEKNYYDSDLVQLNIRRRDGAPGIRDWRHFQAIKNQLVGEECEGIELYPAESRLVDTSNKYHIWCIADPTFRFPIGFEERDVVEHEVKGPPGVRQRGM